VKTRGHPGETDKRLLTRPFAFSRPSCASLLRKSGKRLRYQLPHGAGRLAFFGRRAKLYLQDTWPWAGELVAAFERLKALPADAG
jgi:hypothetical protein